MERERLSKRQVISMAIGVLTLIILVSSATYAYFKVSIGNTATSTTITGDIGGGSLGTVTLSGGGSKLYLGLSAYDMSESKKGTTYYSSTTEGSRETNVNNAGKTTYTATLSGDESDSVMYACDYEFTVTSTGTALGKESINDIELVFNGDINKTINLAGTDKVSGTWFGFKNSNKERAFDAHLQLSNTDSEQNDLAGTNLSVEIKNTKWNCYLSENDELVGEAYALYTESNKTLTFVRSETPIADGDIYNDVTITKVYTGFEEASYTSYDEVPWFGYNDQISNVAFEDEIRPVSTAYLFSELYNLTSLDVTKLNTSLVTDMSSMFQLGSSLKAITGLETLDTSNVTDMSYMFWGVPINADIGISNWDTSNVTDMSSMFYEASFKADINLSGWDVSNVTDMSGMFMFTYTNYDINGLESWDVSCVENMSFMFNSTSIAKNLYLSNWDTSNVTNMSSMFGGSELDILAIAGWNVSNVTDMSGMFEASILNTNLDLSNWDVSNVIYYYSNFDNIDSYGSTGTLIPPVWENLYFGVYSKDDYSLRIYNDLDIPSVGDTYNNKTVTKVYNMSTRPDTSSKPVSCSTSIVPTSIIVEDNIVAPSSTYEWFSGCTKVNYIDLTKLDTSNVTNMYRMFYNVGSDSTVTSMTIIGIDSFDTSNVTSMSHTFYNFGLNATYTLDLSGWDVSKVSYHTNFNYGVATKVIAPTWETN